MKICVAMTFCTLLIYSSANRSFEVLQPGDGLWGTWTDYKVCPKDSFVTAFRLRIEPYQGILADDSGLNAIELLCTSNVNLVTSAYIRPHNGIEGVWTSFSETSCETGKFATAVALRSDAENSGIGSKIKVVFNDDRGATDMKLKCEDGKELTSTADMLGKHKGTWGNYETCHVGFAICGLRVRMASHDGDGTALNGAQFACCPMSEEVKKEHSTNMKKNIQENQSTTLKTNYRNDRFFESSTPIAPQAPIHIHIKNTYPRAPHGTKNRQQELAMKLDTRYPEPRLKELAPTVNSLEHMAGPNGGIAIGVIMAAFVLISILVVVLIWAIKQLRRREVVGGIALRDMPTNIGHENHYCTVE